MAGAEKVVSKGMDKKIYCYGEDGITLWAISDVDGRGKLIEALRIEDEGKIKRIYYRPSFGRNPGFGEFDIIVVTKPFVYLVEAKDLRGKSKESKIVLTSAQWARHLFMEMLILARFSKPESIQDFVKKVEKTFNKKPLRRLNNPKSDNKNEVFYTNLESCLKDIGEMAGPDVRVTHVLLGYVNEGDTSGKGREVKLDEEKDAKKDYEFNRGNMLDAFPEEKFEYRQIEFNGKAQFEVSFGVEIPKQAEGVEAVK